jgi:hypothetical protein
MRRFAVLLALTLAAPAPLAAHSVGARVSEIPGVVVDLFYADGEIMAFAEAQAFSPADPANPFSVGRADRQGRFAFAPDMPGAWRVEARDHEGHAVAIDVQVKASAVAASRWEQPRTWALFASLVLNLFALLAWFEFKDFKRRNRGGAAPSQM